jgi:hypothetical protein
MNLIFTRTPVTYALATVGKDGEPHNRYVVHRGNVPRLDPSKEEPHAGAR